MQQRIALPTEAYPSMIDGKVQFIDRMVDTAPYVAIAAITSTAASRRLGTAALLNVTAGGGSQTPTFIVERR